MIKKKSLGPSVFHHTTSSHTAFAISTVFGAGHLIPPSALVFALAPLARGYLSLPAVASRHFLLDPSPPIFAVLRIIRKRQ